MGPEFSENNNHDYQDQDFDAISSQLNYLSTEQRKMATYAMERGSLQIKLNEFTNQEPIILDHACSDYNISPKKQFPLSKHSDGPSSSKNQSLPKVQPNHLMWSTLVLDDLTQKLYLGNRLQSNKASDSRKPALNNKGRLNMFGLIGRKINRQPSLKHQTSSPSSIHQMVASNNFRFGPIEEEL